MSLIYTNNFLTLNCLQFAEMAFCPQQTGRRAQTDSRALCVIIDFHVSHRTTTQTKGNSAKK